MEQVAEAPLSPAVPAEDIFQISNLTLPNVEGDSENRSPEMISCLGCATTFTSCCATRCRCN